jgi:hypothetical protein
MGASRTVLNKHRFNRRLNHNRPKGQRAVIGPKGSRSSRRVEVSDRVNPGSLYGLTYAECGLRAFLHVTKGLRVELA